MSCASAAYTVVRNLPFSVAKGQTSTGNIPIPTGRYKFGFCRVIGKSQFAEVFIMIKKVTKKDIVECVNVIKESFSTVANGFGFTAENAPRFTAFATTQERLKWHLHKKHRPMYTFYDKGIIVG